MTGVSDGRNISGWTAEEGRNGGSRGGKEKRKRGRGGGGTSRGECEDRYYNSEEYSKLSKANRVWLRRIRDKRVKK